VADEDGPAPELPAARRTAACSAAALAPRMVSDTRPDLKTRNVGILVAPLSAEMFYGQRVRGGFLGRRKAYAEMPYWLTMSLLRSVSTLAKARLPGELFDEASFSKTGDIALHGPHLLLAVRLRICG
jgi:hypothetical protein